MASHAFIDGKDSTIALTMRVLCTSWEGARTCSQATSRKGKTQVWLLNRDIETEGRFKNQSTYVTTVYSALCTNK